MFQRWYPSSFSSFCRAFSLFSIILFAAHAEGKEARLPKILQEVEAKYAKSATLAADFAQTNFSSTLSQTTHSAGKLFVKRPSHVRWETTQPDPNLLIGNSEKFWFYTPPFEPDEHGQVIEKPSSEVQSQLAGALLSGSFTIAGDMSIKARGPTTFDLIPKKGTAGTVALATISIDLKRKLIEKVVLNHQGGNRTEVLLSHIQLGKQLNDQLFVFNPPPNTDRITE